MRLISSISAASVVDLPEPVGPGDQDEAARPLGELVQAAREPELLEREDPVRDQTEDCGGRASLEEDVDAEAGDAGDRVREVDLPVDLEPLLLLGREDAVEELLRVVRRQLGQLLQDGHLAAHAGDRRRARGDVQVGSPERFHALEQLVDRVDGGHSGRAIGSARPILNGPLGLPRLSRGFHPF